MKTGVGRVGLTGCLLLLGLIGHPQPSVAQTIQGQLLDRDTGSGVEGALVLLLSPDLEAKGGSLTGADGRFVTTAPGPGRYLLKVYRIGYETTTSEVMELTRGQVVDIGIETRTSPIELAELTVEAESNCLIRPGEGLELARAWEEASKALTVQEWAEEEEFFRFRAIQFQRKMDPEGYLVIREPGGRGRGQTQYRAVRETPGGDHRNRLRYLRVDIEGV